MVHPPEHAIDLTIFCFYSCRTPLHWASVSGQEDCVKFLLELGVMHSPRDINNCTPLDYAKQANKPECMKELIKTGAEYGVTQPPTTQGSGSKDGTPSRKNSGQCTKKKRFGFLSDIFSRTKNGLRSKQSSVESNEENSTVVESRGAMEMDLRQSEQSSDAKNNVCAIASAKTDTAEDQSGDHSHDWSHDKNSRSHEKQKRKLHDKWIVQKTNSCHSDLANVCDSNESGHIGQRSLSDASQNDTDCYDIVHKRDSYRNRSASIPTSALSSTLAESRSSSSSPLPDRIPPFSHHALLPSPIMSGVKSLPGAYSSKNAHSGLTSGHDDKLMGEPIVGLKPLCRDLPDAVTVQRHAQEILEAQRGMCSETIMVVCEQKYNYSVCDFKLACDVKYYCTLYHNPLVNLIPLCISFP